MGIGTCERCKRYGDHEPWCREQRLSESKLSGWLATLTDYLEEEIEILKRGDCGLNHDQRAAMHCAYRNVEDKIKNLVGS